MSIDWFTFAAQIINFLILVLLLRWFLYGPIVRAMQQREEEHAARLQQAEDARREGERRALQHAQQLQTLEDQREALLQEARHQANEQRTQLAQDAREEVQHKRLEWLQAFEREREDLLSELRHHAGRLSAQVARRTLEELADESLEQRMFAGFTARLSTLDDEQRAELQRFLGNGQVLVRSAFQVSHPWRERLQAAVRDEFGYQGNIDFEICPDLICGMELEAGGYRLGWNVGEFLQNLETELHERLETGNESRRT